MMETLQKLDWLCFSFAFHSVSAETLKYATAFQNECTVASNLHKVI